MDRSVAGDVRVAVGRVGHELDDGLGLTSEEVDRDEVDAEAGQGLLGRVDLEAGGVEGLLVEALLALEQLGAEVRVGDDYTVEAMALVGTDIFLDEPSVTGSESWVVR